MSKYYEDMTKEFKDAVEVIKGYCQFEDCSEDCKNCPYPLGTIRCGDEIGGEFDEQVQGRG